MEGVTEDNPLIWKCKEQFVLPCTWTLQSPPNAIVIQRLIEIKMFYKSHIRVNWLLCLNIFWPLHHSSLCRQLHHCLTLKSVETLDFHVKRYTHTHTEWFLCLLQQSSNSSSTSYHLQRALPGGIVLMELAFQVRPSSVCASHGIQSGSGHRISLLAHQQSFSQEGCEGLDGEPAKMFNGVFLPLSRYLELLIFKHT